MTKVNSDEINTAIEYLLGGCVACVDQPEIGKMLQDLLAERDALLYALLVAIS